MTKKQFRAVVGFNIALSIVSVIAIFTLAPALPAELESWVSHQSDQPYGVFDWIMVVLAVPSLVATVGLFFFTRWSRAVYAVTAIVLTAATLFAGPSVATGVESFAHDAVQFLDGVIITLAYFSDARHYFEPHAQPATA